MTPDLIWRPSPNFETGRRGHVPLIVVRHRTDGPLEPSLAWLENPASEVSAHVVSAKDGRLFQMVQPQDTAWTNGRVEAGHRASILDEQMQNGLYINPNHYSLTIEYEAGRDEEITPDQHAATVGLVAWLYRNWIPHWFVDRKHIVNHGDISPLTRGYCRFSEEESFAFIQAVRTVLWPRPDCQPYIDALTLERDALDVDAYRARTRRDNLKQVLRA
ncbi:MAG: N-acetylmuramoyl-L-alanine amidase [Gammaproteobacteria bacterium]